MSMPTNREENETFVMGGQFWFITFDRKDWERKKKNMRSGGELYKIFYATPNREMKDIYDVTDAELAELRYFGLMLGFVNGSKSASIRTDADDEGKNPVRQLLIPYSAKFDRQVSKCLHSEWGSPNHDSNDFYRG